MIDEQFVTHLQSLASKGASGVTEMREFLKSSGGITRLIALAAIGVSKAPRKKSPAQAELPGTEFPAWWPTEAWEGYLTMRKRKRLVPTERAVRLLVKALTTLRAEGNDPVSVLDRSTINGWTDVYPLRGATPSVAATVVFEQTTLAGWISRLDLFYYGDPENNVPVGFWHEKWGAAPGQPGCRVPQQALDQHRARTASNARTGHP